MHPLSPSIPPLFHFDLDSETAPQMFSCPQSPFLDEKHIAGSEPRGPHGANHSADEAIRVALMSDLSEARRLMTHPGIGPVTALVFVLTIGPVTRFRRSKQTMSR
jgi:Transposase IS116/IS110/IS902 family